MDGWLFGILNLEFGFWNLDVGGPVQIGRGNRPAALGEPLGRNTRRHSFIEKVRTPSGKPGCGELYSGVKVLGSGLQSLRYESLDADVDTDSNGYIDADMDSDTIAYIDVNVPHISMQIDMNLNMGTYIWIHRRM